MKKLLFLVVLILETATFAGSRALLSSPVPTKKSHLVLKNCSKKPIVVMIIDTGYGHGTNFIATDHLCKFGHKNFVDENNSTAFDTKDPVPVDMYGHGSNIAGIIGGFANTAGANYCLVIVRYWNSSIGYSMNEINTIKAIEYARQIKADFINYSGGGLAASQEEIDAVKKYIDEGGTFIAAAGNEHSDLAEKPYYPAMDDPRVVVVGNGKDSEHRSRLSNYGERINAWENGDSIRAHDITLTGTSQATAIHTGKTIAGIKNSCK